MGGTATKIVSIGEVWGMEKEYNQAVRDRQQIAAGLQQEQTDSHHGFKRRKADDGLPLVELPVRYDKKCYLPAMSPKQSLHEWCVKCNYKNPVYKTEEHAGDRSFNCKVLVDDKWYTTPFWEKRKQYAEQSAAMCFLLTHGIDDGRVKEPSDQTPELRQKWLHLAKSEHQSSEKEALSVLCSESSKTDLDEMPIDAEAKISNHTVSSHS